MNEQIKTSKIVSNLFYSWDRKKVSYCHWKSIDHLDATYEAKTDIDVLVDKKDNDLAIQLALQNGFIEVKSSHFRGYPGVRDFISYDAEMISWVHLHFHTQLSAGDRWVKAYHFPFEAIILENKIWNENYDTWTIAPIYELLLLIYRMNAKFKKNWLRDKKIQEEIKFIQLAFTEKPSSIDSRLGSYIGQSGIDLLYKLIETKDFSLLEIRSFRHSFEPKEFLRMSRFRLFFLSKLRYGYRIYSEIRRRKLKRYSSGRRTFPKGGFIIAFIGIDGSGKSSGIKRIASFFAQQINVQTCFLGSGKSGAGLIRKTIMNVVGFKANTKGHIEARELGKKEKVNMVQERKPPLHYVLWIWLVTIDRERQLKWIQRGLGNGNLVLVDRWLQDERMDAADAPRLNAFIECKGIVGRVARREKRLYNKIKLIPLHLVLKINILPKTSVERKPNELNIEEAAAAIERLNLLRWPDSTLINNINGDENIEVVTTNLKKAIFQLLNN